MSTYETEIVRKVYDNDCGEAVTVAPSPDFPGNVIVYIEERHKKHFGDFRLDLPAEMMMKLGRAILDAAKEAENLA